MTSVNINKQIYLDIRVLLNIYFKIKFLHLNVSMGFSTSFITKDKKQITFKLESNGKESYLLNTKSIIIFIKTLKSTIVEYPNYDCGQEISLNDVSIFDECVSECNMDTFSSSGFTSRKSSLGMTNSLEIAKGMAYDKIPTNFGINDDTYILQFKKEIEDLNKQFSYLALDMIRLESSIRNVRPGRKSEMIEKKKCLEADNNKLWNETLIVFKNIISQVNINNETDQICKDILEVFKIHIQIYNLCNEFKIKIPNSFLFTTLNNKIISLSLVENNPSITVRLLDIHLELIQTNITEIKKRFDNLLNKLRLQNVRKEDISCDLIDSEVCTEHYKLWKETLIKFKNIISQVDINNETDQICKDILKVFTLHIQIYNLCKVSKIKLLNSFTFTTLNNKIITLSHDGDNIRITVTL